MAAISQTGTKCKPLSIQKKLEIINKVDATSNANTNTNIYPPPPQGEKGESVRERGRERAGEVLSSSCT
jgi:hypothetical protein